MNKEIATPNLAEIAYEIEQLVLDGYTIDKDGLQQLGNLYIVNMLAPQEKSQVKPQDKLKAPKKAKEASE